MRIIVDQVLHGYADGHRLLAGSLKLPAAVERRLLVHSDGRPISNEQRSISSLPLPEIAAWALTGTWAADEMPRPGSVWSHSLILSVESIAELKGAAGLLEALRRPRTPRDLDAYRAKVALRQQHLQPLAADRALIESILLAVYGWPGEAGGVLTPNLARAEVALLAAWEQQWLELRVDSRFATRTRVGSPDEATLQVARAASPRGSRLVVLDSQHPSASTPPWLKPLTDDIFQPGPLREFLHRFGTDTTRARAEMTVLVRLHRTLTDADGQDHKPFAAVAKAYPEPKDMARLKYALLGRHGSVWPAPEPARVLAALEFHEHLQWHYLDLSDRVQALWPDQKGPFVEALWLASRASDELLAETVLLAAANLGDQQALVAVATARPAVAAELVTRNTRLLYCAAFWHEPAAWQQPLLRAVAATGRIRADERLAKALIESESDELAAEALALDLVSPAALAAAIARAGFSIATLRRYKRVLRERCVDAQPAAAARDSPWVQVALALLSADDSQRRELAFARRHDLAEHLAEFEAAPRLELATELLAALHGPAGERHVWQAAFPPLHRALVTHQLPEQQWRQLDRVLPEGNQWDRAERLRKGLYQSVQRDDWSQEELTQVIQAGGPEADRVRELAPKKGELHKLLDSAWNAISFWD